jgi:serine/threonine protein kinase/tetratricopeptide (TPR) repeat protein
VSEPSLDPSRLGELAEEFVDRRQRGERPTVEEYAERYPDLADQIRAFFPALLVVEDLKPGRHDLTASFLDGAGPGHGSVPERLGDYRVIREIGRGGMGVVYEAEQESLGRRVALKVLASSAIIDPKRVARFHREAKSAARLHHTNIVPVFGVGESDGVHYYVMQFIAGAGLDAVLDDVRRLRVGGSGGAAAGSADLSMAARSLLGDPSPPPASDSETSAAASSPAAPGTSVLSAASEPGRSYARSVAHVGMQVAEALEYAHEQGVLHRDIKPSNVLLDAHGIAWVTDFGLAKASADDDLTHTGDIVGTIRYMAPERFHGGCDARSDVYALGLTLYELLAGRPAFEATDRNALIRQVSQVEPTRLRRLDPSLPRDLETIVHKAIEKDPNHRYPTAGALADDLRCYLDDRPIRARRATAVERAWRWSRRNRATAALAATAVASIGIAAVVGWVGYMSTTRALERESRRRGEAEIATRRAEQNVALSLEVFEELFQRLAPGDALPPPPLGRSVRDVPPRHDDDPNHPPQGPGGRRPPPPEHVGRTFGPPDRREAPEADTALLRGMLDFYERFAARNATNPRLQGEAAWAYRKVGALFERLGREAEAEVAYARAIAMFEELVARDPASPEFRFRLVETYDMADPWTAPPSSLERLDRRLVRAATLIDQLVAESPGNVEYGLARIHVLAKLGVVAQLLKRADDAEARYRRAIAVESEFLGRRPRDARGLLDRATTRQALAILQLDRGRRDEARALLDAAVADLDNLATFDRGHPMSSDRLERLAKSFQALGATDRAEELMRRAAQARDRHGPPGEGPPPPPDGPP